MNGVIILVAILFAFLYGSINYYIGLRVWQNLGIHIPYLNAKIYWVLFSIVAVSYIFTTLLPSFLPSIISNRLNIIGSYWMAMMFYLILMLSIIDLIKILNKKFVFIPRSLFETANVSLIVTIVVGVFIFGIMVYGTWSARNAIVTKYDLNSNKIVSKKKTLKVIMVSDIHLGVIVDNNRLTDMVNKINELNPDIVFIPGDIIDSNLDPFVKEKMGDNFKRIKSKYGVYACLGNHEGIAGNVDDVVKNFESAGINVLRDKAVLINNSFYVIGREDTSLERATKVKRKDLSYLIKDLDKSKPLLLMDHQPGNLSEPENQKIDLQLSGHTHRGQLFPANIITKAIFEIDYGYLKKKNSQFIVSSGYGTWGPPIRLGSRSEIVEMNLKFK
ncbi:metallophosphoesterase [Clostridium lacusfryxellense]|uniref:metallophosphoesterase n=1 Tax=Clostridium lacusfryxellense TaxID=205328 RepID=UPI001C0D8582|nr:metallophosphoesterase [Clostridium lacusfryxellense]MBU3112911.1 metallophosphoesterase [Clostridium lacusfryxellense]